MAVDVEVDEGVLDRDREGRRGGLPAEGGSRRNPGLPRHRHADKTRGEANGGWGAAPQQEAGQGLWTK